MTARFDFTDRTGDGPVLHEGAAFSFTFEIKDGDPSLPLSTFTPVDLTGFTAAMKIRQVGPRGGGREVLSLTTANGRIAIDGPSGAVAVSIAEAETVGLDFSTGEYALDLVDAGGVTTRELAGLVLYRRNTNR